MSATANSGKTQKLDCFRLSYIPALDGVRGLAILAVVCFHSQLCRGGYLGVDIFFTLSGFLITSLLLKEWERYGTISWKRFYLRRVLRLAPALLAVLATACTFEMLYRPFPGVDHILMRSAYALSYFGNWVWAFHPADNPLGSLDATWSLAIEEQFYLVWPGALLFLLRRVSLKSIGFALLSALFASMAWRFWLWNADAHTFRIYAGTDTHAGPILIGCLTAVTLYSKSSAAADIVRRWIAVLAILALAVLLRAILVAGYPRNEWVFLPELVGVATAILIVSITAIPTGVPIAFFTLGPLRWLGVISYGLYLWHGIFSQYVQHLDLFDSRAGEIGLGLVLALLSWFIIERPILSLKTTLALAR
jgi:peptidoglycan/LPS O-acetylase OafA/YrhL